MNINNHSEPVRNYCEIDDINRCVRQDVSAFIAAGEARYHEQIDNAAQMLAQNLKTCNIALLTGPSASGKTTTAKKLAEALLRRGINSHSVSLDDYYKSRNINEDPLDEYGNVDLESPFCLDISLIVKHMKALSEYEEVRIPRFDFQNQRRADDSHALRLGRDEVVIIEGIHALNDLITSDIGEHAFKIYASARMRVTDDKYVIVHPEWMRLIRRIVRDANFRGANVGMTLSLWNNIRRGEILYIAPFKSRADISIDTSITYELGAMAGFVLPHIGDLDDDAFENVGVKPLAALLNRFEPVSEKLIPDNSLLREFIGGSIYKY